LGTSKYLQDEVPSKSIPVRLDSGRNEHEGFQVILHSSTPVSSVRISTGDLRSGKSVVPASNIELRLARYIEVKKNLSGGYRAGLYPDALVPMPETFGLESGKGQMVWVNIYVPKDAVPGIYKGQLTIAVGSEKERIPIRLRVRNFGLSVENHSGSAFAIWKDQAATYYNLDGSSPEFKAMYDRYYWFLTGYRLPPDDLPVPIESSDAAKYLNDPRVTSYRIPYVPEDPEGFAKRAEILRRNGWLSRGYVYTIDEPDSSTFGTCAEYGRKLHSVAPDVKWLLTAAPDKRLIGNVNIWSPVLHEFDRKDCADRQAHGDTVWWYTCCAPQHPYPTYLINDSATSPRILSWFQSRNNVEGVLYWAMNIWRKWDGTKYVDRDVWTDPLAFPGANGDGYLIYPGKTPNDDPVPSLRLEMIRKGNEDFETLHLLQAKYSSVAENLGIPAADYNPHSRIDDYVNRLGRSLVNCSRDPKVLEGVRADVMSDIESADAGPKAIVSTSVSEGTYGTPQTVEAKIWAEKGCSICASVISEGRRIEIPVGLKSVDGKGCLLGTCSVSLAEGDSSLVIVLHKGGMTKEIKRVYRIEPEKPITVSGGKILSAWNSKDALKDWELEGTRVAPTETKELGECAKVTYKADVDFPRIRLVFHGGTSLKDAKFLNFSFYNPNDQDAIVYGKIGDLDGKVVDGKVVPMEAGKTCVYNLSIAELSENLDTSRIAWVELWMWHCSTPVTIYLGPVTESESEVK
jgi:hypothetical protein